MNTEALVSVIMPAFNAERFITAAVNSVIQQTYANWELLVVNDGSTDSTAALLADFTDPRIKVFHQPNSGIGSARNAGLAQAKGLFLCFLDSDDVLPAKSLEARLAEFASDPTLDIVDGRVLFVDEGLSNILREYRPSFKGSPFHELVTFSERCFMGLSWMIRWGSQGSLRYDESITHAEDLLFCLEYCRGRQLGYTDETVLLYRRTGNTSMTTNFDGMDRSLRSIGSKLKQKGMVSWYQFVVYSLKRKRIMAGTYWHAGRPWPAFKALWH